MASGLIVDNGVGDRLMVGNGSWDVGDTVVRGAASEAGAAAEDELIFGWRTSLLIDCAVAAAIGR